MGRDLNESIDFIARVAQAFERSMEELTALNKYGRIRYNIDFAYLFPVLLRRPEPFNSESLKSMADRILSLKNKDEKWIRLYISRPSFAEFLDMLEHLSAGLHRSNLIVLPEDQRLNILNKKKVKFEGGISSDEMLNILQSINSRLLPPVGEDAIRRIVELINNGIIEGLDNDIDLADFEFDADDFTKLLEKMTKDRSKRDFRPSDDRRFHYGIDAMNIVMTMKANEPLFLLSPSASRFGEYLSDRKKPRTLLSALFTKSVVLSNKEQNNDEARYTVELFSSLSKIVSNEETEVDMTLYSKTFISYGGPDEVLAKRLYVALKNKGVDCWFFPEDSIPGKKLHRTMYEGVNDFEKVVLVCSKASLDRPGVLNEIQETLQREAREGGKEILIPITIDEYVYSEWAPGYSNIAQSVRDRVIADFSDFERNFDKPINKLLKGLER